MQANTSGASAHYFVGFEGRDMAVGGRAQYRLALQTNAYKHPECRNSNSIGIEL